MNDKDVENLSSWQTTSYWTRTLLQEVTWLVSQSAGANIYQKKQGKLQKVTLYLDDINTSTTVILSLLL